VRQMGRLRNRADRMVDRPTDRSRPMRYRLRQRPVAMRLRPVRRRAQAKDRPATSVRAVVLTRSRRAGGRITAGAENSAKRRATAVAASQASRPPLSSMTSLHRVTSRNLGPFPRRASERTHLFGCRRAIAGLKFSQKTSFVLYQKDVCSLWGS
jgi:hypothetical protein